MAAVELEKHFLRYIGGFRVMKHPVGARAHSRVLREEQPLEC